MISNGEGWHYLAVKELPALLRGITSKRHGNFCCLNCLHSFRTEKRLKSLKKVFENKDFLNIVMSYEGTKILEFEQKEKSDKAPFIIYVDLECLIEKIDGCKNNSKNSSTAKLGEDIFISFSISTKISFKNIGNKHGVCRVKDCRKNFCVSLRQHALKIINFKKKKMKLLTNEKQKSYQNLKTSNTCK